MWETGGGDIKISEPLNELTQIYQTFSKFQHCKAKKIKMNKISKPNCYYSLSKGICDFFEVSIHEYQFLKPVIIL